MAAPTTNKKLQEYIKAKKALEVAKEEAKKELGDRFKKALGSLRAKPASPEMEAIRADLDGLLKRMGQHIIKEMKASKTKSRPEGSDSIRVKGISYTVTIAKTKPPKPKKKATEGNGNTGSDLPGPDDV